MSKTALITGASNGIGKELAYHFAKDGINLVLVARSEAKLQELKMDLIGKWDIQVEVMSRDLSRMEEVQSLSEELKEKQIEIHYLVNNAGYGLFGNFTETDMEVELSMIDLNIKSLTLLTKLLVKDMVKKGKGGILNVASTASFQPGPLMAVYYATKAYVLSFTEALENELQGTGVTVTALCPGPTETGFGDRANLSSSKLFKGKLMNVTEVAEAAYAGLTTGKSLIIPGFQNRMLTVLVRLLPRKTITAIVRNVKEKI